VSGFDGLRGVGVLVVVVGHMSVLGVGHGLLFLPGGTIALDAFFVLSGFLITTLLLKEQQGTGRIGLGGFYSRRALRLLPALVVLLVIHGIYAYFTHLNGHIERVTLTSVLFYYSNYYLALAHPQSLLGGAPFVGGMKHLWSLAVEEQFYLVWPVVVIVFLGVQRSLKVVVCVLLTIIFAITVYRWVGWHGTASYYGLFVRTDYRADAMLWGALLAHLWVRHREPTRFVHILAWPALFLLAYWMAFVPETEWYLYRGGLTLIDLSCAVLVLALLQERWVGTHVFKWKPFVIVGGVSYGIYIWHFPIYEVVERYGAHWPEMARVVVALAATALATTLSWFLVEKRAMERKQKLRAPTTEDAPAPGTEDEPAPAITPDVAPAD
jgi:peptidoglycan/LPS O-acetylase OafA/YrhL